MATLTRRCKSYESGQGRIFGKLLPHSAIPFCFLRRSSGYTETGPVPASAMEIGSRQPLPQESRHHRKLKRVPSFEIAPDVVPKKNLAKSTMVT
jgi:hypothetical protein